MDYLDKALFPDFTSLLPLVANEPDGKRYNAIQLAAKGNLDAGAVLLAEYLREKSPHDLETNLGELSHRLDRHVNEWVVGLFGNAYSLRRKAKPKAAIDLLRAAADLHYEDAAYNAANALLHDSGSPDDIVLAEQYYRQAIEDAQDPSKKSAAIVNYCEIVRDGRITGTPDYPGAIALYEQAAELGLVTAMFNVGNVAMWMRNQSHESHVGKGIYWLTRLKEHFDLKKPFLKMDQSNVGQAFLDSALDILIKLHVLTDAPEANVDVGYELLLAQPVTPECAKGRQWVLEQALIKRLRKSGKPVQNTPGLNWHHVLGQIGWICCEHSDAEEISAELFTVETEDHVDFLFLVMNGLFDPEKPSNYVVGLVNHLRAAGVRRFFIAPSHALFRHHEGRNYTPVLAGSQDSLGVGFIGLEGGPEAAFGSRMHPIDDLEYLSADSCVISIAINRLNEGCSLRNDLDLGSMYGGFGDWGLPMKNEESSKSIHLI
jgi:hypothetical protein